MQHTIALDVSRIQRELPPDYELIVKIPAGNESVEIWVEDEFGNEVTPDEEVNTVAEVIEQCLEFAKEDAERDNQS